MAGPEITFLFQFGNLRDIVTVDASTLNLKSLKDLACDFINTKVRAFAAFQNLSKIIRNKLVFIPFSLKIP